MTTVTATPVTRPRVPVRKTDTGVLAECRHCDWTLAGHFPAEVSLSVAYHREQHRRGDLEVTR